MMAEDDARTEKELRALLRGEILVMEEVPNSIVGQGVEAGLEILVAGGVDRPAKVMVTVVIAEEDGVILGIVTGTETADAVRHQVAGPRAAMTRTVTRVGPRVGRDRIRTRMAKITRTRMAVVAPRPGVDLEVHSRIALIILNAVVGVRGAGLPVDQDGMAVGRGREVDRLLSGLAIITTVTIGGDDRIRRVKDRRGRGPSLGHLLDLEVEVVLVVAEVAEVEVEVVEVGRVESEEARTCQAPT